MSDIYVNIDKLGYRNTDVRSATYGIGAAFEDVDDNTARDTRTDRDVLEQNLKPQDYAWAADLFGKYYSMFVSGITKAHRKHVRAVADRFNLWAHNIDDAFIREACRLDAKLKKDLDEQLCLLTSQIGTIAGTTRMGFMSSIKARAARDAVIELNAQKLSAYQNMQALQAQAIGNASSAVYQAYIQGDQADYDKLISTLSVMKGSWTRQDFADRVRDNIERDITTKRLTADWQRTAGSTSETAGEYAGDYSDVLAAASAVGGIIPAP